MTAAFPAQTNEAFMTMRKLSPQDLFSLERYAQTRPAFRAEVLEHKRARRLPLGPNAALYFEDRLTIHYQVQEMLRIEKITDKEGIAEELAAYNPLIPDGRNWKATFMLEFGDAEERKRRLAGLVGIEGGLWMRVGEGEPLAIFYDEDLERATEEKTSAVHFMRMELRPTDIAALRAGAKIAAGIRHAEYTCEVDPVPDAVRASLLRDLAAE